jgi:hypothetical protein
MKAIWKGIEYQVKGAWSGSADNFADIIDQFTKDPGSRTREKLTGLIVDIRTDLMATVIELTNEITSDTSSDNAPENYMIPKAVVLRRAYDTIKLMTRNSTDCLPTEFRDKIRKNYGGEVAGLYLCSRQPTLADNQSPPLYCGRTARGNCPIFTESSSALKKELIAHFRYF